MAIRQMNQIIEQIRHFALVRDGGGLTDAQLLELFVARQDEAAFEAIVRRHGSMVLSVCRRVMQNSHDAEDAFQATFLVLARKASTIRSRELVANWLYGVAYQTALKARMATAKRKARERPMNNTPEPEAVQRECSQDWQYVLDQELNSLPEKYRVPIVLCDLEGKSRKEASQQLGLPDGTLSSRLARARMLLAKKLTRHGVVFSGGAIAAILSQNAASAGVPASLIGATVKAALSFAAGNAVAATLVSAEVAALTEGVLKMMFLSKLKFVALVLFVAAISICGTLIVVGAAASTASIEPFAGAGGQVVVQPVAQPKPSRNGKILVWHDTRFVHRTPDGKEIVALPEHPDKLIMNRPMLSPDGKRVAFTVDAKQPADGDGNIIDGHVFVRNLDGKDTGVKLAMNALNIAWAPDGNHLVVVELLAGKDPKDGGFSTCLVEVATKKKSALDLPRWVHVFGMTPDSKSFIAAAYDLDARKIHLAMVGRNGTNIVKLTEVQIEGPDPKLSPDGMSILFQDVDPAEKVEKDMPQLPRLFVYDLKAKKRTRLAETPTNGQIMGYCWSPDGKQIAYTWRQVHAGVPLAENTNNMNDPKLNTETQSHLVVAGADGSDAKTLTSAKANRATSITIGSLDWR